MRLALLWLAFAVGVMAADFCNPADLRGSYGFQLSGETTISGIPRRTASAGRLVFCGSGGVNGYSSADFAGYLLGNPITGSYEALSDCSIEWTLRDDSGGYQHFAGRTAPGGSRVEFRQTDPGGPAHGLMMRMPDQCDQSTLAPRYRFAVSGAASNTGFVEASAMAVESDCSVTFDLRLPARGSGVRSFRGMLVDDGREILAIETDPAAAVTARLTAQ